MTATRRERRVHGRRRLRRQGRELILKVLDMAERGMALSSISRVAGVPPEIVAQILERAREVKEKYEGGGV